MNLLLIGARGSGKTTVGRLAAAKLDRPFVDLDSVVRGRFAETSVRDIWSVHGESGWRTAEAQAMAHLLMRDGCVIALGGGTPTITDVRAKLQAERRVGRACIVLLSCAVPELQRRLREQDVSDRPTLTGADPVSEVPTVLLARLPIDRELADVEIDVSQHSPETAAFRVCQVVREARPRSG